MSHDTWIHRLSRVVIVNPLMGTRVTPNQITTARLVAGLSAAAAIAAGVAPWQDIGAALFVASLLMDRADGDYARLTGQTSREGHRYDLIADGACNALVFLALGWGARDGTYGHWAVIMGLIAGLAVAGVLLLVVLIEARAGYRAAELGGVAGLDPDDAMLAVPLAVWLGWTEPILVAASIGASAFALFFLFRFRRDLAGPRHS